MGLSHQNTAGMPNEYICDTSRSGDCSSSTSGLSAFVVLPPCSESNTGNCIENVSLGSSGTLSEAKLVGLAGGPTIAARADEDLPAGSTPSLWQGAIGATPLNVAAIFVLKLGYSNGSFRPYAFDASLIPYSVTSGNYTEGTQSVRVLDNGRSAVGFHGDPNCVWQDTGRCGIREDFPKETLAKVSIRLTSKLGGWFRGRLGSPNIQVAKIDAQSNRIEVTGEPAVVPQISVGVKKSDATATIGDLFSKANNPGYVGGFIGIRADYPNTPAFLSAFRDVAKDTAQGLLSNWSFTTLSGGSNTCLADTSKVLGLVTTNASVYDGQAPEFSDSSLVYKVAGYHYLPGGSLNLGTYDLIMRKETARCLYGFSSAPISASVSVTSDSGTENVATTNFTEEGDWDHFSAYGFTFSNPKIQVKLAQKTEPSPSPSPSVTNTSPSKSKKVTITCVKGKTVKKVTAVSPKCPAGYKKK